MPSSARSTVAAAEPPVIASIWIDAAPDHVFPYFTDPARLTQWLGHAAELDPREGGRFAVDINDRLVRGRYIEVARPHRVVFSWGDAGSARLPRAGRRSPSAITVSRARCAPTTRAAGPSCWRSS